MPETTPDDGAIGTLRGVVERGDQRGRTLGFPTLNLPLDDSDPCHAALRDGVWAGRVRVGSAERVTEYTAAISIGRRVSFYGRDGVRLAEAHLLDFEGDLYGRTVVVMLDAYLRPQRRYRTASELVDQLYRDVEATRDRLIRSLDAFDTAPPPRPRPGRWGPVERARDREASEVQERIRRRDARRLRAITAAVAGFPDPRDVSHDAIARITGLPTDLVRWLFPRREDLLSTIGATDGAIGSVQLRR